MRSKYFLSKFNWTITFVSVILAIIVAASEDSFLRIFTQPNAFNSLTVILLILLSAFVYLATQYFADIREAKLVKEKHELQQSLNTEKEDHRKTKMLLAISQRKVYDIDNERMTDVITGIPNHLMFEKDVQSIKESMKHGELYQIIMIDIDDFSSINTRYGYFTGDELIKAIAQELYYSMRRNEKIFKQRFIPHGEPLTEAVYRKYNGGDEFIIVIKGDQDEAIGFINRLHRQLTNFSDKTVAILKEKFLIRFHAGIAPLYAEDESPAIILQRVEDCFLLAKRPDSKLRIKWFKETPEQVNNQLYKTAKELFKKND